MKIVVETLGEFEAALKSMKSGQIAQMHYDVYATLFPPGEPDQDARARAAAVAKTHGCVIENRPQDPQVIFKKIRAIASVRQEHRDLRRQMFAPYCREVGK